MYKPVPKRSIHRLDDKPVNQELQNLTIMLELCKEADDDLWRQLILHHLDNMKMLDGKKGNRIRKEIRRKLRRGL